jgi:hypothetical protein
MLESAESGNQALLSLVPVNGKFLKKMASQISFFFVSPPDQIFAAKNKRPESWISLKS